MPIPELESGLGCCLRLSTSREKLPKCVENLQREDIHPLEEALGFKSLLELGEPAYTIATIASRAGKSEAYVYGRIRLADLIPPVAEAFLKDQITIGHALLIAKLPASQQQEALLSFLLTRQSPESHLSRQVSRRPQTPPPQQEATVCGPGYDSRRSTTVCKTTPPAPSSRLGGLRQACFRRPHAGVALSGSLHPSRSDFQSSIVSL